MRPHLYLILDFWLPDLSGKGVWHPSYGLWASSSPSPMDAFLESSKLVAGTVISSFKTGPGIIRLTVIHEGRSTQSNLIEFRQDFWCTYSIPGLIRSENPKADERLTLYSPGVPSLLRDCWEVVRYPHALW